MIVYEVTASVAPDQRETYESYMVTVHINEVLATRRFVHAIFAGREGKYRTAYFAEDQAALDEYLERDAAELRDEMMRQFPEGVSYSREVFDVFANQGSAESSVFSR